MARAGTARTNTRRAAAYIGKGIIPGAGGGVLGPSTAAFTAGAASGTLIAAITGLATGETIDTVVPNDGRLALDGTRRNLLVGLTAATAGAIAATLTTSTGRTLGLALTVGPGVLKPIAESFMIQGMGAGFPGSAYTTVAGKEAAYQRVAIVSADYATPKLRAFYTNNYTQPVSNPAKPTPDEFVYQPGNAVTIHAMLVRYNGQNYPVTFNGGQSSVDVPDGGFVMWDEVVGLPTLPANSSYFIDQVISVPAGSVRVAGRNRITTAGEFQTNNSLANLSALMANMGLAVPGGTSEGGAAGQIWAPALVVGTGNDGRDVVMFNGDSFSSADGDNLSILPGAFYISGPIARGLYSTAQGTKRIPHVNWGIAGSRPSGFLDNAIGHWGAYHALLNAVMTLNNGRPPFTLWIAEGVNNEMSVTGATLEGVKQNIRAHLTFVKSLYPGIRVVQIGPVPAILYDVVNQNTTVASQTYRSQDIIYPVGTGYEGARWVVGDYLQSLVGTILDGFIDYLPTIADTATRKWRPRPFAGKVVTPNTANGFTITLDTKPPLGEALAFDPGGTNYENTSQLPAVRSVVANGANWDVTTTTSMAKVHAANENVKGAPTRGDGVHGSTAVYIDLGDGPICGGKVGGLIRQSGVA